MFSLYKYKILMFNDNDNIVLFLSSFKDILHINEGRVLQYESKYNNIKMQCRRKQAEKDWCNISKSPNKIIKAGITEVKVNDLRVDKVYEFRGLFEDTTDGKIVQLNSKEIKIKSNNNFTKFVFINY